MNDIDLEILSAYIDEELDAPQTDAIKQRLENDPALRMVYKKMHTDNQLIKQSIFLIDESPVSPRLNALLDSADTAVSVESRGSIIMSFFNQLKSIFTVPKESLFWPSAAMASVLFVMVSIIYFNTKAIHEDVVKLSVSGKLVPDLISSSLSTAVSGSEVHISDFTVKHKLAFMRDDNVLCKQYEVRSSNELVNAVACYSNGDWRNTVVERSTILSVEENTYQTASGDSGSFVDNYIQEKIKDIPLSSMEERALLDSKLAK
ncbi:MAG: hypothetical protein K6L76_07965 [Agarilytica sp.]